MIPPPIQLPRSAGTSIHRPLFATHDRSCSSRIGTILSWDVVRSASSTHCIRNPRLLRITVSQLARMNQDGHASASAPRVTFGWA